MSTTRRFTIVTAVHDVARYLADFIDSIERQTVGLRRIEVIAVDDGSTDDSLGLLERWQRERPELVTVLTQENAGQAAARNRGLDVATGEWIGFIDPDDWVVDDYLETVSRFIDRNPTCSMVACNRVYWEESTGERRDGHPLRSLFDGDRLIDLNDRPDHFHTSAPAAFFRRDRVESLQLRFDPRIRPHFEDGHFCTRYLLDEQRPTVGFLESAEYLYRRRGDNSSTLQGSLAHPGRFLEVPRLGYLDVLHRSTERHGTVPGWLQTLVLYELSWYFSAESAPNPALSAGRGEIGQAFVATLREIRQFLDADAITGFRRRRYADEWRQVVLHGLIDETWHSPSVRSTRKRVPGGAVELSYYLVGPPPTEEIWDGDALAKPVFQRTRSVRYFGQALLHERIVRVVPSVQPRVALDGTDVEIRATDHVPAIREVGGGARPLATVARVVRQFVRRLLDVAASAPIVARRFESAWILIDDRPDGTRSAETVFRHLRTEHPDVNAFYAVTGAGSAAGRALTGAAETDKILRIGSIRWRLALRNCDELISSGPGLHYSGDFRVTFVSNGAIEERHAAWLNEVRPDHIVTTFEHETAAITAGGGPWRFSAGQVHRLGSPSIDAIRSATDSTAESTAPAVVVAEQPGDDWSDLAALLRPDSGDLGMTAGASLIVREFPTPFTWSAGDLKCLDDARVVVTANPHIAFCAAALGTPAIRVGAYAHYESRHAAAGSVQRCADLVNQMLGTGTGGLDATADSSDRADGRNSLRLVRLLQST